MAVASSTTAHAQSERPAPSANAADAAEAEARARFSEGIKRARAGDHETARVKFNQAWALLKSPVILFNLATSERLSGHPVEAIEHYRLFLRMDPDPKITEAQREQAAEGVNELLKTVARIDVDAPAGARIWIDGEAIEGRGSFVPVLPGRHTVEAIVGGETKRVTVDCPPGAITTATLTARPLPAAPPSDTVSTAGASGRAAESPSAPSFWTTGRIVGATAAGVGLVGVASAVVFQINASRHADEAAQIRATFPPGSQTACSHPAPENVDRCSRLLVAVDDQRTQAGLRTGFLIGGGAVLAGGAILFLLSRPEKRPADERAPRASLRVVPFAAGREAGLGLVGRF